MGRIHHYLTRVHRPRILTNDDIRVPVVGEGPLVVDGDHVSVNGVAVDIVVVRRVVAGPVVGGRHARPEGVEEVELGAGLRGAQLAGAPHWGEAIGRGVQDIRTIVKLITLQAAISYEF